MSDTLEATTKVHLPADSTSVVLQIAIDAQTTKSVELLRRYVAMLVRYAIRLEGVIDGTCRSLKQIPEEK